jgi:hypothetical protein
MGNGSSCGFNDFRQDANIESIDPVPSYDRAVKVTFINRSGIYVNPCDYGVLSPSFSMSMTKPRTQENQLNFVFEFESNNGEKIEFVNTFSVTPSGEEYYLVPNSPDVRGFEFEPGTSAFTMKRRHVREPYYLIWEVFLDINMEYYYGAVRCRSVFLSTTEPSDEKKRYQLPPSPSGTLPTLLGTVSLTPDGNELCEVDYQLIETNLERKHKIYSPSFLFYVKGCQKTIPSAVSFLNQYQEVNQDRFVTYAILRTILSSVVFSITFDFRYLRQRYYSRFLCLLAGSPWKDFLVYFEREEYGVTNYYSVFIK